MSLVNRRLMKWREQKIKGIITLQNVMVAIALVFVSSLAFGFLGGHGKFNVSVWLLGLAFLSIAPLSLAIQALLPGTLVQLREDMIVYGLRGANSKRSAYRDIEHIYYTRNCALSIVRNSLIIKVHTGKEGGPFCTNFQVVNRNEDFYSVNRFTVPNNVDLAKVLQILREKSVPVSESQMPPQEIALSSNRKRDDGDLSQTNFVRR